MKKTTFSQNLLDKYIANECTVEEKILVEGWYNKELSRNSYSLDDSHFQQTEDQIWQALQTRQKNIKTIPARKIKLWQVISAAAASITIVILLNLFVINKPQKDTSLALSTVVAPGKENNLIQLPDGSTVILETGSKLSFSTSFEGKKLREVYLTGKAFFDIKHKPSQPFIVRSGKIKTTVLGTAFDISATPGTNEIVVKVIRGKVNVSTDQRTLGDLLPNKQIKYNLKTEKAVLSTVDVQKELMWTNQSLLLSDITFASICELIEKRYSVKISIKDESLKMKKFTISMDENESMDHFLTTICDFNNATYKYNKESNSITIHSL